MASLKNIQVIKAMEIEWHRSAVKTTVVPKSQRWASVPQNCLTVHNTDNPREMAYTGKRILLEEFSK